MRTALLLAVVLALPMRARACWDGYLIDTGDGIFFTGSDESWSEHDAVTLGSWALRLRALLGADGTLTAELGSGEASIGADRVIDLENLRTPREMFDAIADELGTTPAERAALLAIEAHPYSVQVAASRDRDAAMRLATRLSEHDLPRGYYEAGGFPADNPEAHVIEGVAADGQPVFRVLVGVFLDRASAAQAAPDIASTTGMPVSLRAL